MSRKVRGYTLIEFVIIACVVALMFGLAMAVRNGSSKPGPNPVPKVVITINTPTGPVDLEENYLFTPSSKIGVDKSKTDNQTLKAGVLYKVAGFDPDLRMAKVLPSEGPENPIAVSNDALKEMEHLFSFDAWQTGSNWFHAKDLEFEKRRAAASNVAATQKK